MLDRTPVPKFATLAGVTAASMLLGICCAPALAAPADVLCEETSEHTASLEVEADEFSVDVVDHGTDDLVDDSPLGPMIPRADTILRQIFDETLPAGQADSAATAASESAAAPIAELTKPVERVAEKADSDKDTEPVEGTREMETHLPGYAEDEVRRYRRQMYRTDI